MAENKTQRVELAMKIKRYRQMASRIADEQFQTGAAELIAELEKKLREIDECRTVS